MKSQYNMQEEKDITQLAPVKDNTTCKIDYTQLWKIMLQVTMYDDAINNCIRQTTGRWSTTARKIMQPGAAVKNYAASYCVE